MARLFFGLELPDDVAAELSFMEGGLPRARYTPRENLHVTLVFLGECDGGVLRRLEDQLARLAVPRFRLSLGAAGVFPPSGPPRSIHLEVQASAALEALHQQLVGLARREGLAPDRRRFIPHVTLARLKGTPPRRVGAFVATRSLYRSRPFAVERVCLFSSVLTPSGSRYRVEAGVATVPEK